MPHENQKPRFLNRKQASEHLKALGITVAPATLQKLASEGGGPKYRRFGRHALYTVDDLNAWVEARPAIESARQVRK